MPAPDEAADPELRPLGSVRRLHVLLFGQAASYCVAALIGVTAYYARGAEHLGVGGYAAARTHPIALVVLGGAAAGLLVWAARRVVSHPVMVGPWIRVVEVVLVVDAALGVLFGLFNLWLIAGLFVAMAVLWILRTEPTANYLF